MIDTLTVLAYLFAHDARISNHLKLQVLLSHDANSPKLVWRGVPPEAKSLAVVVKDDHSRYCWVVYNISPDAKQFPPGLNQTIRPQYEGWNSWGVRGYHPIHSHSATVTVYAIDQRFEATHLTGNELTKKIQGHVLAEAKTSLRR